MFARDDGSGSERWVRVGVVVVVIASMSGITGLSGAQRTVREWRDYAGGPDSSRFVAATQINRTNVGSMAVAWTYPAGDTDFNPARRARRRLQPGARHRARGARRGDGQGALGARRHRGLRAPRRELLGERGRRRTGGCSSARSNMLRAIDARTGKPIPSFGADGRRGSARGPRPRSRDGQAAEPTARQGVREPDHPRLGDQSRVHVGARRHPRVRRPHGRARVDVPHRAACRRVRRRHLAAERARDTSAAPTTGPSCRSTPARGIVYVPTGSAKYNFYGGYRHGDNLFADCLIALDARTGRRLWHFQTVHHDIWDLDNNSAPQLTTIRHDGRRDRRRRRWRARPAISTCSIA